MIFILAISLFFTNLLYGQEGRISINFNNRGGIINTDFVGYGEIWFKSIGLRSSAGYEYQVLGFENNFLIQSSIAYRTKYGNIVLTPFYFYWNADTKRHITPILMAYEREFPESRVQIGLDNSHGLKPFISFQKNIFKLVSIKSKKS